MFRTFALAGIAALTLSTAAWSAERTVRSVDVEVQLDAITNPKAAAYWSNLSVDLQNAIAARVVNQIANDGVNIDIDIDEFSLSDGFQEQMGLADTRLAGRVKMTDPTGGGRTGTYDLSVDINQAKAMIPQDVNLTVLPADTRTYYNAMIDSFAQAVVDRLR